MSAAAFSSTYPPSIHSFRGAITMRLASGGADVDELIDEFTELAGNFAENFPDDAPVAPSEVPDVMVEVVDAYLAAVTEMSADAVGLMAALDELFDAGILYSYGDAFDASDAMEDLEDALEAMQADGGTLRGYLYSLIGDLDEMVLDGRLEVAFGTFDADSAAVPGLANDAVEILVRNGLKASWSGDLADPIVIEPIVMDVPLVEDDDHEGHGH